MHERPRRLTRLCRGRRVCDDHRAYDCHRSTPVSGHGGRRPGAGAPRGNLNALSHGRRSQDDRLRRLLARVPADVRAELLPWLKAAGVRTIKRRLAWLPKEDPRLLPFPTSTTSTHAEQSSPALDALALRMTAWGFFGAAAFARAHSPAAPVIAQILDYFDQAGADSAHSPGALLRHLVHEEIAQRDRGRLSCPYCPWTAAIANGATS